MTASIGGEDVPLRSLAAASNEEHRYSGLSLQYAKDGRNTGNFENAGNGENTGWGCEICSNFEPA